MLHWTLWVLSFAFSAANLNFLKPAGHSPFLKGKQFIYGELCQKKKIPKHQACCSSMDFHVWLRLLFLTWKMWNTSIASCKWCLFSELLCVQPQEYERKFRQRTEKTHFACRQDLISVAFSNVQELCFSC